MPSTEVINDIYVIILGKNYAKKNNYLYAFLYRILDCKVYRIV